MCVCVCACMQGYPVCIVSHVQACRRLDLGYEPTPEYMWSNGSLEPKRNVWLKTIVIPSKNICMVAERFSELPFTCKFFVLQHSSFAQTMDDLVPIGMATYEPEMVGKILLLFKLVATGAVTFTHALFLKWRQYKHQLQAETQQQQQTQQFDDNMAVLAIQGTPGNTTSGSPDAATPLGYDFDVLDGTGCRAAAVPTTIGGVASAEAAKPITTTTGRDRQCSSTEATLGNGHARPSDEQRDTTIEATIGTTTSDHRCTRQTTAASRQRESAEGPYVGTMHTIQRQLATRPTTHRPFTSTRPPTANYYGTYNSNLRNGGQC